MSPTADSQPKPAVLIAGSGPSGLILALTLVKNDIPVRIIEKDSEFHEGQRGSGVQPRTLEVFNYLGCLDDMLKKAKPAEPRAVYKLPEGVEIAKIVEMAPYIPPTPSVPYRNPVIHGQASSEAVLRTHLAKYNIFVELETELVDFQQNPDSVTAHVVKRSGGKEVRETLTVDWLVGADGAHSFVRNKLGLTFLGETRPAESIIIADVEVKGLSTDYWHSWGDQSTKSVWLRPTETPGVFHLMAGGKQADLATMQQGREQIIKYILDVTNRHDLEFREVKFVKEWRPNIRIVNKFSEGRVFVIGDAGHVHSPTGGQGMNTGVQDAVSQRATDAQ
ncbi:hypothetical protein NM688_g7904 [Phlebia brevispora]|uniref:Uncharacterized protein n=1 Tax=Phlebia brevispora TaxID=194682 RepID=A0ACC1RZR3_9APHY|nr:hypothetical protein NM688_g7904 [Phlebia brevispora]